jgi:RNA recognition motif-containing protein
MQKFRVFIGCVPGDAQDKEVLDILKTFAKVTSIKLARGRNSANEPYCVGYGFVNCSSQADVDTLVALKQVLYRGRDLSLRCFKQGNTLKSEKKMFTNCRVFVGGITTWIKFESLKPLFERYGALDAFYQVDLSKGMKFKYGYAVYTTPQAAAEAVKLLNGFVYKGCTLRVERFGSKPSDSKEVLTSATPLNHPSSSSIKSSGQRRFGQVSPCSNLDLGNHTVEDQMNSETEYAFESLDITQSRATYGIRRDDSRQAFISQGSRLLRHEINQIASGSEQYTTGKGCFWVVPSFSLDHSNINIRINAAGKNPGLLARA